MNKIELQVAKAITSLGMVLFVLLMTVTAMLFVGHGLYYHVFLKCLPPWQADIAAWVLSCGVETTVLVIACNVKYFQGRQLPGFFAVCSGFIILFFVDAFNISQPPLEIAMRWFIGLLVSGVNWVYCELFVRKLHDSQDQVDLFDRIEALNQQNNNYNLELTATRGNLESTKHELEKMMTYVADLEIFKQKEIDKVTCKFCGTRFPTIYHHNSHVRGCESNPRKGLKQSVFDGVINERRN